MKSKIQIRIGMWSAVVCPILFTLLCLQESNFGISVSDVMTFLFVASIFVGFALSVKFRKLKTSLILWFFIGFIPISGWIYSTDHYALEFIMFCFMEMVILFLLSQAIRGVFKEVKKKVDIDRVAGVVGIIAGIVFFASFLGIKGVPYILGVLCGPIGGFVVFAVVRWLVLGFTTLEEAKPEKVVKAEPTILKETTQKNTSNGY